VSGWYKRHIAKWSLIIGAMLVLLLNVNSISIARTLYTDEDVRAAVTALATESTRCQDLQGQALDTCQNTLAGQLLNAQEAGLPLGWTVIPQCRQPGACQSIGERYGLLARGRGWWDWHPLVVLLGWLITVAALVPGARFWFDTLGRIGSLRTTGPKPATTATS
jgi:hypothetical protein